ncbi:hypothetical protein RBB50_007727 [Rhinocladiella similis]
MCPVRISSVSFEHHPNGFGIGHRSPRISWRFSADDDVKDWSQESADIHIVRSRDKDGKTYPVKGPESVLVPWPGDDLESREAAWVKVRSYGKATDAAGNAIGNITEWSSPVFVEAALLEKRDWTAKLTTSSLSCSRKGAIPPTLFRKVFPLSELLGPIAKARVYITAHGLYEAVINGHRVGNEQMSPGWTSYSHRLTYQTFDVTSLVSPGKMNVFGVEIGEGWFAGRLGSSGKEHIYGNRLAFIAQLEVAFENGQTFTVVSDSTWKSHGGPTKRSEIYNGEDYDSREEQEHWDSDAKFDDQGWIAAEELDFPSASLLASDAPPVRITEELSPMNIFKSKSGKTLIDFGQNLVGKVSIRLPAASDGQTLVIHHAEVLENGELGTRALRSAKATDSVVLSQRQPTTWCPKFTFHGFRYVQLDGWPSHDATPDYSDVTALVLHSDMKRTGWFCCSDPLVNKLHQNVLWSMKGNFLSVPTDCPQRDERLGWTGDIQIFGPTATFLFDTKGFLEGWLQDLSAEQLEEGRNGIPPLVVPDISDPKLSAGPQSIWHDVTVLTPWDLYMSSGDVENLRRQYPSMKAWVDEGISRGSNGLWNQDLWQLGDWLDPTSPPDEPGAGRTDSLLVADAYLFRVLDTISRVSLVLGESEDADRYAKDALRVQKAFEREYVTPAGLLVGDTQTAHALALCFGLFGDKAKVAKSSSRLSHLVHAAEYRIGTGFAGTPLICQALSDTGHSQLAYRMLLEQECPSWLYPVTMGATTIWERWDSMLPNGLINPGAMTSFNHYALGSVATWLHQNVGGLSPATPGWQVFKVRPVPGGTITSASVTYESPYGRIDCSWYVNVVSKMFNLTVTVPPNSKAVVVLPCDWQWQGDEMEEKSITITSGKHEFSCPFSPAEWPPKPELTRSIIRVKI